MSLVIFDGFFKVAASCVLSLVNVIFFLSNRFRLNYIIVGNCISPFFKNAAGPFKKSAAELKFDIPNVWILSLVMFDGFFEVAYIVFLSYI